ncbi:MAG: hypothetical protein QGI45_06020, partial [Myxococcota bacterium]|nr:hypothetical protein [Myxococcota bacterium]
MTLFKSLFRKLDSLSFILGIALLLAGCGDSGQDNEKNNTDPGDTGDTVHAGIVTSATSLDTLEGCPNGGILIEFGIDENANGTLDPD